MKQGRKISGGKYKRARKRKLYELPGIPRVVKLGKDKGKFLRTRGGNIKRVSLSAETANVMVKGKAKKAKIKNVLETPSNRFLARQNVLVKGALIDTDLGKARITNRPSQDGHVQAILLEK